MAISLNRATLIGNVGKDPESRFTSSNIEILKFSLATTHSYKKDEQWENKTTWHNITLFKPSDWLKEQITTGAKLYVEGRINVNEYEKDGEKKFFTEIVCDKVIPMTQPKDRVDTVEYENPEAPKEDLPF